MSALGFYLSKSILGLNFPLFYLIFRLNFPTRHPHMKLILGHWLHDLEFKGIALYSDRLSPHSRVDVGYFIFALPANIFLYQG